MRFSGSLKHRRFMEALLNADKAFIARLDDEALADALGIARGQQWETATAAVIAEMESRRRDAVRPDRERDYGRETPARESDVLRGKRWKKK